MVCVPSAAGGVYSPPVVIVPTVALPPAIPSTVQFTVPLLGVNTWVEEKVSAATRGLIWNPVPVPDKLMLCGLPTALSLITTDDDRVPVVAGVKVILIVQLAAGFSVVTQLLV